MEARLSELPRGSTLHFDPDPRGASSTFTATQFNALKTCCEKKGITFLVSNVD